MTLTGTGIAMIAASLGIAASAPHGSTARLSTTPFGGLTQVHITRVGHIEFDLEPTAHRTLRSVPCVGLPAETSCYVSSLTTDESRSPRCGLRCRRALLGVVAVGSNKVAKLGNDVARTPRKRLLQQSARGPATRARA